MKARKFLTIYISAAICTSCFTGCSERTEAPIVDSVASESLPESSADSTATSVADSNASGEGAGESSFVQSSAALETSESAPESSSTNETTSGSMPESSSISTATSVSTSETPVSSNSSATSSSASSSSSTKPVSTSSSATSTSTSSSTSKTPVESVPEVHKHSYKEVKKTAATCTTPGYATFACSCGEQYTKNTDEALGHKYASKVYKATCTENGYTLYTCGRCSDSYKSNVTYATGHSWGNWETTKEPTASSEGEQRSKCSSCGASRTQTLPKKKDVTAFRNEVIRLVNVERANNGLSPLTANTELMEYAQLRSGELVELFDHTRPNGESALKYVMALDNVCTSGENIAWGQSSPESVMRAWMNSPGHRSNILSESFTAIGVGCYESGGTLHWVQIFAGYFQ